VGNATGFRQSATGRDGDIATIVVTGFEDRETKSTEGKTIAKFTVYMFDVTTFDGSQWTVIHSYSEVLDFHKQQKKTGNEAIDNFPFPPQV
jgi:hypothetical protein